VTPVLQPGAAKPLANVYVASESSVSGRTVAVGLTGSSVPTFGITAEPTWVSAVPPRLIVPAANNW